ncbi:MAG: redoxin domain-containing protein [Candidatus Bipolaricaulota bacterium]
MRTFERLAVVGFALLFLLAGCDATDLPMALLVAPIVTGDAPLEVAFDLSYTTHPQGRSMSYELDFGDGTAPVTGREFGVIQRHVYEADGAFEAVLLVADEQGGLGTDRLTITVNASGPAVGTEVGNTAPDFSSTTTDGTPFTLWEMRGSVVLLDFWGAWCPPCRASLPHLDELVATYAERGVVAVLVSTDLDVADSVAFLSANGFERFVSLWEPGGKAGNPIAQLYKVSGPDVGIPRTYVIDRQGVIRYVGHPIELTVDHLEAIL